MPRSAPVTVFPAMTRVWPILPPCRAWPMTAMPIPAGATGGSICETTLSVMATAWLITPTVTNWPTPMPRARRPALTSVTVLPATLTLPLIVPFDTRLST